MSQSPETPASPESTARDHFNEVITVAKWNVHDGEYAFFSTHTFTRGIGKVVQRVVSIHNSSVDETYTPSPDVPPPDWMKSRCMGTVTYTYDRWRVDGPDDPETLEDSIKSDRGLGFIPRTGLKPLKYADAYHAATVPSVCYAFGRLAQSLDDLAHITKTYADWMDEQPRTLGRGVTTLPASLIGRSLLLARDQTTYGTTATNPFLAVLEQVHPLHSAYPFFISGVTSTMKKVLLGEKVLAHPHLQELVPRPIMIDTIRALDSIGLITTDVWLGTGMAGGVAARDKDFLQLLHSKIAGDKQPRLISGAVEVRHDFIARAYITALLDTYAKDTARNPEIIARIQQATTPPGQKAVSRSKLIALANGLAKGWNGDTADSTEHYGMLDPYNPHNLGDALMRVLRITQRSGSDESLLTEEDLMHVEVLEALLTLTSDTLKHVSLGDVRLRYPHLEAAQLYELMTQINAGLSPAELRAYARKHQIPLHLRKRDI